MFVCLFVLLVSERGQSSNEVTVGWVWEEKGWRWGFGMEGEVRCIRVVALSQLKQEVHKADKLKVHNLTS